MHYTHRDVFLQEISCLVFLEIFCTHDGHTHTHFVMTDFCSICTTETAVHSTSMLIVFCVNGLSRLPGVHGYTCCRTGVWSESRVTKRSTGDGEVGKMTHQPTLNELTKTHKASLILTFGPVTSPCLHCPAGCLVAPVHKCCCNPRVLARSRVFCIF